jgi:pantoate--beta-alanine ligase
VQEISTIGQLRHQLNQTQAAGQSIGFVPTMGALHAGHMSLIERARNENDCVVVSIFVNPLQFGKNEDLNKYPRLIENDRELTERAGVDFLFVPSVDEMYPGRTEDNTGILTTISVSKLTRTMEGALRPGHFDGVATVVGKLFSIVGPCRAYFGEKDWQQLGVIRRMVNDLSMPVDVVGCETVRETDGLALSSRNVYLHPEARASAVRLSQALFGSRDLISQGERSVATITDYIVTAITTHNVVVNYADIVNADFVSLIDVEPGARICVSASVWGTNLIDNVGLPL